MSPLVSIVIPAKNAARTIAATIASCRAQTHPRREIIVVDNGCTDDTIARAKAVAGGERLLVVHCDTPGSGPSRNAGAAVADGEAIVFLDADDEMAPRKLERQLACIEDHGGLENAVLVGSDFLVRDSLHGEELTTCMAQVLREDRLFDVLRGAYWVPPGAYLFTRAAVCRVAAAGGFSASARLQDREYVAFSLLHGVRPLHVPEPLFRYHIWSSQQDSYSMARHHYAPLAAAIYARVDAESARIGATVSAEVRRLLRSSHDVFRWRPLPMRQSLHGFSVELAGRQRPLDFYETAVLHATRGPDPFFATMAADRAVVIAPALDDRYLELVAAVGRLADSGLLEGVTPSPVSAPSRDERAVRLARS